MIGASDSEKTYIESGNSEKASGIAIDKMPYNGNAHTAREAGLTEKDVLAAEEITKTAKAKQDDTYDPWKALPGYADDGPTWKELSTREKVWRVAKVILKILTMLLMLYLFVCSIDVLGSAFQVVGGRSAGYLFAQGSVLANPVAGLMVGVLTTVLLQSSSTTTSIIVAMVAAGIISVEVAIPIIMGCNIGTTITNTIVSLGQAGEKDQFRRAFAGATVHDVFNWSVVCILLPIEILTGYLYHLSSWLVSIMDLSADPGKIQGLSVITDPLTDLIIQVDKAVITAIARDNQDIIKRPIIQYWDDEVTAEFSQTFPRGMVNQTFVDLKQAEVWTQDFYEVNVTKIENNASVLYTVVYWTEALAENSTLARHLFQGCGIPGAPLGETGVGLLLLFVSLAVLLISLILLVKILSSLLQGAALRLVNRVLNTELPGRLSWLTGYIAMILGILFTIVLQSSSVFTSILTPLVGIGVLTIERMYPLTLGSNIGTTVTSLIAAFAGSNVVQALQISLCHLFFNITGVILFYPLPLTRAWPCFLAKKMGNATADHRWFALAYIVVMFLIVPAAVLGLSLGGWQILCGIGLPILSLIITVVITNTWQDSSPSLLPPFLRDWTFLPIYFRSLDPYDKVFSKCPKCQKQHSGIVSPITDDSSTISQSSSVSVDKIIPIDNKA